MSTTDRAKEIRKDPRFDRMVEELLDSSNEAEDWLTAADCVSWLDERDELAGDRVARALATNEALAKECRCGPGQASCPVHGESAVGT